MLFLLFILFFKVCDLPSFFLGYKLAYTDSRKLSEILSVNIEGIFHHIKDFQKGRSSMPYLNIYFTNALDIEILNSFKDLFSD